MFVSIATATPAGAIRHRVDVSPALPGQRVPKPPALRVEGGERACASSSERRLDYDEQVKPAASVEAQPDGREEQQPGERAYGDSAAGD